ncbi:MAG TPA: hypothetical protein VL197_16565 [Nitrospirota bacterium]|nr:hypothetical protein [Nitrospirota bacterium]
MKTRSAFFPVRRRHANGKRPEAGNPASPPEKAGTGACSVVTIVIPT